VAVAVHICPDQMSKADYERERLFATLQGAGVDAGTVDVHPLHSGHPD
jgi:hypothetical protein